MSGNTVGPRPMLRLSKGNKVLTLLEPGDLVEVDDPGLKMLRDLCPDQPPNHHGRVLELLKGNRVMVEFPIDGSYEHSQSSPYPIDMVRKR